MTSRERVEAALDHREPDRVPLDLGAGPTSGMPSQQAPSPSLCAARGTTHSRVKYAWSTNAYVGTTEDHWKENTSLLCRPSGALCGVGMVPGLAPWATNLSRLRGWRCRCVRFYQWLSARKGQTRFRSCLASLASTFERAQKSLFLLRKCAARDTYSIRSKQHESLH